MKKNWNNLTLKEFNEIDSIFKEDITDLLKTLKIQKVLYGEEKGDIEFLQSPIPERKVKKKYKVGGYNLRFCGNIKDLSTSQYIDYINSKTLQDYVSVLLVPEGSKYNDGSYDLDDLKEKLLGLEFLDVKAMSSFLFGQLERFVKISQDYLKNPSTQEALKKTMSEEELELILKLTESLFLYIKSVESLI